MLRLAWRERRQPLTASAAWVPRAVVFRILERVAELRGVGTPAGLVLLGGAAELPWIDGVRYFGVDPAAPSLLLPTTRAPVFAVELVERALRRAFEGPGPWLVDDSERRVIPLDRAGRVDRTRADAWLGNHA